MMMLKNHKTDGFSLLEIMVALVILSTAFMALIALQGSLNKSAVRSKAQNARLSALLNTIAESIQFDWVGQQKNTVSRSADDDRVRIEYAVKKIESNSSLKELQFLKKVECTATSQYATLKGQDALQFFIFSEPEKDKKNA